MDGVQILIHVSVPQAGMDRNVKYLYVMASPQHMDWYALVTEIVPILIPANVKMDGPVISVNMQYVME